MAEVVSAAITNSRGESAGYGYFTRRRDGSAGSYRGSGANRITNTSQNTGGTSGMNRAIATSGARQASRRSRATRGTSVRL